MSRRSRQEGFLIWGRASDTISTLPVKNPNKFRYASSPRPPPAPDPTSKEYNEGLQQENKLVVEDLESFPLQDSEEVPSSLLTQFSGEPQIVNCCLAISQLAATSPWAPGSTLPSHTPTQSPTEIATDSVKGTCLVLCSLFSLNN